MTDQKPSSSQFCQICRKNTAIYTCPRCLFKTCSLPCSKQHKQLTRCTGERNKAAYVPMNAYTEGKLLDDFAWLEEGRRKVEQWGKEIDKGKLANSSSSSSSQVDRNGSFGHQRGRGRDAGYPGQPRLPNRESKVEVLKRELASRGIHMQTLPDGMEKRRLNQSGIDAKTGLIYLSVQSVFHLPPSAASSSPTFTYLLVRAPLNSTIESLYASHPRRPPSFPSLPPLGPESVAVDSKSPSEEQQSSESASVSNPLDAIILAFRSGSDSKPTRYLPPLDTTTTLEECLRGMTFVEYPSLELWFKEDWQKALEEGSVVVVEKETVSEEAPSGVEMETKVEDAAPQAKRSADEALEMGGQEAQGDAKRQKVEDETTQSELVGQGELEPAKPTVASEAEMDRVPVVSGGGIGLVAYGSSDEED